MGKQQSFVASYILISSFFILCNSCNSKNEKGETVIKKPDTTIIPRPAKNNFNPYAAIDISPMDMSYFPVDYPILKMQKRSQGPPLARVIYSRPHLQGRRLFHEVLKYGEPWRLGANESSELDLYHDATIQGKKIVAGRYVIYCIPSAENWTIVFNTNIDSWGLEPDPAMDIEKFVVPVSTVNNSLEYFTIVFEKTNTGANMVMAWDNVEARLPIFFP
jgi:hypothetical protein